MNTSRLRRRRRFCCRCDSSWPGSRGARWSGRCPSGGTACPCGLTGPPRPDRRRSARAPRSRPSWRCASAAVASPLLRRGVVAVAGCGRRAQPPPRGRPLCPGPRCPAAGTAAGTASGAEPGWHFNRQFLGLSFSLKNHLSFGLRLHTLVNSSKQVVYGISSGFSSQNSMRLRQ